MKLLLNRNFVLSIYPNWALKMEFVKRKLKSNVYFNWQFDNGFIIIVSFILFDSFIPQNQESPILILRLLINKPYLQNIERKAMLSLIGIRMLRLFLLIFLFIFVKMCTYIYIFTLFSFYFRFFLLAFQYRRVFV